MSDDTNRIAEIAAEIIAIPADGNEVMAVARRVTERWPDVTWPEFAEAMGRVAEIHRTGDFGEVARIRQDAHAAR
ncbi:hypothetical protein ACQVP2_28220 [Methylobacterium aquaticum]|uniref:hypothetical protein n=1 Tax=Methylobacterium aquaticum TaxID=270351 RepID=UPI003D187057